MGAFQPCSARCRLRMWATSARGVSLHVMTFVTVGAGHPLLCAKRRTVIGRPCNPLCVCGVAVCTKTVLGIGRTAHLSPVFRDNLLQMQICRRETRPFAAREELERILRMHPVTGDARNGAARGQIFALHNPFHVTLKEHAVASQAVIGRFPCGVVRFVLKENVSGLAVSASRPLLRLRLMAFRASAAQVLDLAFRKTECRIQLGVVRTHEMLHASLDVVRKSL